MFRLKVPVSALGETTFLTWIVAVGVGAVGVMTQSEGSEGRDADGYEHTSLSLAVAPPTSAKLTVHATYVSVLEDTNGLAAVESTQVVPLLLTVTALSQLVAEESSHL